MIATFRVLTLFALALFWGGLTFYTGFVVRIAHDVVDDPMDGGLITQRVTLILQHLACAAILMLLVNAAITCRGSRAFGISLGILSLVLGAAVAGLFWVHGALDAVIDVQAAEITDRDEFTILHRRYNQLTTVEWISTVLCMMMLPIAWRSNDF